MQNEVRVTVVCITYNHEKYIDKCLRGIVMQKTDFPFEAIVYDDASPDGTAEIIKKYENEYPEIIKPFYQKDNTFKRHYNKYHDIYALAKGDYLAICEGDDFWTDPYKLQKQFDFMEAHPDYSLCGTSAYLAREDDTFMPEMFSVEGGSREIPTGEIIDDWCMATASLFYRKDKRVVDIPYMGNCSNGDYATAVYLALNGRVYYIDEPTCAYRIMSIGSFSYRSRSDPEFYRKVRTAYLEMLERIDEFSEYKYTDIIKNKIDHDYFEMCRALGDYKGAKKAEKRFKELSLFEKSKLYVKYKFPKAIRFVRKARGQI